MPLDTKKGRWMSDASSSQVRRTSRFAAPENQLATQFVQDELEPVLNKDDLSQGLSHNLRQSQFGRNLHQNNFQNTDEDAEDDFQGSSLRGGIQGAAAHMFKSSEQIKVSVVSQGQQFSRV